jgi:uncharacterized protein with HEPN domain
MLQIRDMARVVVQFSATRGYEQFRSDDLVHHGCVRYVEMLGASANRLPTEFRLEHPEINWQDLIDLRYRVVHEYDTYDHDEVWQTISTCVPDMLALLEKILGPDAD